MKNRKIQKSVLMIIEPSWVSNLIGVTAGLLIVIGGAVLSRYQGSQLQQSVFDYHSQTGPGAVSGASLTYQYIAGNIANNHVLNILPLFLVWAGIGLIIYYFTMAIYRAFSQAAELKNELDDYVHVSKHDLVHEALLHLATRLAALLVWFLLLRVTLTVALPYVLSLAQAVSKHVSLKTILAAIGGVVIIYLVVQLNAICVRLLMLRPRVFSSQEIDI